MTKSSKIDVLLEPGARFQLSPLGIERCPRQVSHTGVVIDVARTKSGVRVLFDGTKAIRIIHRTYIIPATESPVGIVNQMPLAALSGSG
jgi:hypothetical protein